MPSCLGLYIENNIIKYAKISKDHDNIRIESFGMKFYDNAEETIKQIINETYSYKTPITVNLSDESYTYAQLFKLLNKKDLEKAVSTEFDFFCNETGKNQNAIEYRNILIPNLTNTDKTTSLYVYTDRTNIVGKLQLLDAYKVNKVIPLPLSISNLINPSDRRNSIIVNIENNTSITTIVNGQIQKVDTIDIGMKEILESIMIKENSYAKAYEICKNTTIYTTQGRNLQLEENEYMEDIMPILYRIIGRVQEIIISNEIEISNIYLTGLAAAINNIDLYFEENFIGKTCEIVTPFFIKKTNVKLNIKDYIEVNSAISLALQGVGIGEKEINFKKSSAFEQLSGLINLDLGSKKEKIEDSNIEKKETKSNFGSKLKGMIESTSEKGFDIIEANLLRGSIALFALLLIYSIFTGTIIKQINKKQNETQSYISYTEEQISNVNKNATLIKNRAEKYESLVQKINEANEKTIQMSAKKNAIPNMLTKIKTEMPTGIQITSIKNKSGKRIEMDVQAMEYDQLGYFVAKIKNKGILSEVTSTAGIKQNEFIKITIQGNLPY